MARMCAGRRAAAAAENAHAEGGGFAREQRKIFRRRFRINDAVAFALGESGVGHAADAHVVDAGKFAAESASSDLRTERAVRADDLDVFIFELRGGIGRAQIAEGGAFFGVSELRDDRQTGKRANGVDGDEQLFDVGERFENEEIDAALFERERLLVENFQNFFRLGMARLHADAQRAHGAGDQHFARCGFARFAGDFYAAAVERCTSSPRPSGASLKRFAPKVLVSMICAPASMYAWCTRKTASGSMAFSSSKQRCGPTDSCRQRAHRAVGDENGVFQTFVEILDLQILFILSLISARRKLRSAFCVSMRLATVLIRSYLVRISNRASPISTKTAGFS